jgi:phosphoribosylaminoimidazolecarboxamide formyltransferase/IMP cyclohydrolase
VFLHPVEEQVKLRYVTNPHQAARLGGHERQLRVLSGEPSYINLLDALSAWPLARQVAEATRRPAAASFKHVSPAGAAVAGSVDQVARSAFDVDPSDDSITSAYIRARDADVKSSYGDMVAVSEPVDDELADALMKVASDGIIAPGFSPGIAGRLAKKKRGTFLVLEIDPAYRPPEWERREVFGFTLEQQTDRVPIGPDLLRGDMSLAAQNTALLAMVSLRYTQSNSVVFARDGMTVGIAAGQQSRVDCTRLCASKSRMWWLRRHPRLRDMSFVAGTSRQDRLNWQIRFLDDDMSPPERALFTAASPNAPEPLRVSERTSWCDRLRDITMASDGFIPFRDNVDVAAQYGVTVLVEPGGSIRSDEVATACAEHGIRHVQHGLRLFRH